MSFDVGSVSLLFRQAPDRDIVRHGGITMIDTDLEGRVERMRFPRSALLPLFEAVSNSIDAIRARQEGRMRNQEISENRVVL